MTHRAQMCVKKHERPCRCCEAKRLVLTSTLATAWPRFFLVLQARWGSQFMVVGISGLLPPAAELRNQQLDRGECLQWLYSGLLEQSTVFFFFSPRLCCRKFVEPLVTWLMQPLLLVINIKWTKTFIHEVGRGRGRCTWFFFFSFLVYGETKY